MLKQITLQETYKVINKKVYAVVKETNSKRELDACLVRQELDKESKALEVEKLELENRLATITNKLVENSRLDSEIAALGYCKIDKPVYKKIDGIVLKDALGNPVIENYTHQNACVNEGV